MLKDNIEKLFEDLDPDQLPAGHPLAGRAKINLPGDPGFSEVTPYAVFKEIRRQAGKLRAPANMNDVIFAFSKMLGISEDEASQKVWNAVSKEQRKWREMRLNNLVK